LIVIEAAQSVGDRRNAFSEHGGVRNDEGVGFQFSFVLLNIIPKTDAADFFFAFDQHLNVDGKLAVEILKRLERFQMNMDLAFVVGGAASKEIAVADHGFKRGGCPQVEGLGRLYVVVPVKKDGGLAWSLEGFGVYEGMQRGGNRFNGLEPSCAQMVADPASGPLDVRLVLAFCADTGDPQEFTQLGQV